MSTGSIIPVELSNRKKSQRYRIGESLGSGAYASVYIGNIINIGNSLVVNYCCKDSEDPRSSLHCKYPTSHPPKVAIKKYTSLASQYNEVEICREISIMRELTEISYPNNQSTVSYIDSYKDNGIWYLVMELCSSTLKNKIKKQYGKDLFYLYGAEICKGLIFLHSQKIIHRDLKPENILISFDGRIKICDFNSAKKIDQPYNCINMTNDICSLRYRAPELLYDSNHYGEEVDLWSYGCILYELLNGVYFCSASSGRVLAGNVKSNTEKINILQREAIIQKLKLINEELNKCSTGVAKKPKGGSTQSPESKLIFSILTFDNTIKRQDRGTADSILKNFLTY